MSDLRSGNESKGPKASTTGSQRGVKSTRTPATRPTKEVELPQPHRSQTVPTPAPVPGSRRGPTSQTSLPVPSTAASQRQRTPPNTQVQPKPTSSPRPEFPEPKSSLDGTGYIVEPLQPSTFGSDSREGASSSNHLAPPSSMPAPKALSDSTRQSVSSFQTEPSSYYSVEEGGSSVGPPMPQGPQQISHDSEPESPIANRYESLWLASQTKAPPMPSPDLGPPMPTSNVGPPRMPSPHHHDENHDDRDFEEYDDDLESSSAANDFEAFNYAADPRRPSGEGPERQSPDAHPKDRYDSSWLAGPSPGMPIPTTGYTSPTANPPMPSPSVSSGARQSQGTARIDYSHTSHGLAAGPRPGAAVGIVPGTAPLRVHHNPRPTGFVGPPSPGASSSAEPTNTSSSNQNQNQPQNQPNPPRVNFHSQQSSDSSAFSTASRPLSERPPANTPTPPSTQKFGSSYESRPPGASAPSIPSGASASTQQNIPAKQYTTQNTTPRPGRTQTVVAPSSSSSSPTAPPATAPTSSTSPSPPPPPPSSTLAQQKPAVQPNSIGSSYQHTKPAVSSNLAPQRLNTNAPPSQAHQPPTSATTTATTTARPHIQVQESNRPSISSPQVQHQTSTSGSASSKHQAKVHEASAAVAAGPTRPRLTGNPSQMDTQYVNMLLALDDIPALHNICAGFFNWILLAGFILFPGTFTSLQNLNAADGVTGQVQKELVNAVTHLPLFIVAWVCTGLGAFGMIWLWWRWRKNYLWGLNKIFLPGFLNSLAGLLSTIANVFGVQHGELVTTSKVTLVVTTASTGVFGLLTAFYSLWLVRRVKARHDREVGKERAGKYGEGVVDLSKRRINGTR